MYFIPHCFCSCNSAHCQCNLYLQLTLLLYFERGVAHRQCIFSMLSIVFTFCANVICPISSFAANLLSLYFTANFSLFPLLVIFVLPGWSVLLSRSQPAGIMLTTGVPTWNTLPCLLLLSNCYARTLLSDLSLVRTLIISRCLSWKLLRTPWLIVMLP